MLVEPVAEGESLCAGCIAKPSTELSTVPSILHLHATLGKVLSKKQPYTPQQFLKHLLDHGADGILDGVLLQYASTAVLSVDGRHSTLATKWQIMYNKEGILGRYAIDASAIDSSKLIASGAQKVVFKGKWKDTPVVVAYMPGRLHKSLHELEVTSALAKIGRLQSAPVYAKLIEVFSCYSIEAKGLDFDGLINVPIADWFSTMGDALPVSLRRQVD